MLMPDCTIKETVIQEITAAFASLRPPEEANLIIDSENHLEDVQFRFALRGRAWMDLDADALMSIFDSLPHLTPESYHYYLPAFLIASLDYYDSDMVGISTIASLRRSALAKQFDERVQQFTPEQLNAVKCFLTFIREYFPDARYLQEAEKAFGMDLNDR